METLNQSNDELILGADIGGTHFRMGLCDASGKLLAHQVLSTATLASAQEGFTKLADILDPTKKAKSFVVGVPGVVDYRESKVIFAPNLPQNFIPELSGEKIAKLLGREVLLVNDADLAAIGEAHFGAGRTKESMSYVTISTGIGAAVTVDKKLIRTRYSIAELGHSFIDASDALANGRGSVEYLASGTALARTAKEAGLSLTNQQLVVAAQAGEPNALLIVKEMAHNVGVALANMVHLFSIESLVLGGGVILSGDFIFNLVQESFQELKPSYLEVEVAKAELGDDAALRGCAAAIAAFTSPSG